MEAVGTLTVGDTAEFHLNIDAIDADLNPENNHFTFKDTIRASFDPNEKHVHPSGYIHAGLEMRYTIHFENLGTDTTFNIHIIDDLSNHLDPSTFQMVYASHLCYPIQFEKDGIQYLKFDFPNIKLPEGSFPDLNKGYVTFKINAKSSMEPGNKIENMASIYFDYNPAIETNTVISAIEIPAGLTENLKEIGIDVYPNPSNGENKINNLNKKYNEIKVVNYLGQIVENKNLSEGFNKLSLSHLPKGVYQLVFSNPNNELATIKLVLK